MLYAVYKAVNSVRVSSYTGKRQEKKNQKNLKIPHVRNCATSVMSPQSGFPGKNSKIGSGIPEFLCIKHLLGGGIIYFQ